MSITTQTIADLVSRIRKSEDRGEFEKLLVIVSDELGIDDVGLHTELEADLDEAIFGASTDAEAIATIQALTEAVIDPEAIMTFPLLESKKRLSESADIKEMVEAFLDSDDDQMILSSIIVQAIEEAATNAQANYEYNVTDSEAEIIADFVEFTVTVGKKRGASADEITRKIELYLSDNAGITESLEEAVAWNVGRRLSEITGASYARDYLAQVDDPTNVTYEDYITWLEDEGVSEQAISKVWFSTNKKRHISNLTSKEPKSSFGKAIAKKKGYKIENPKTAPMPIAKDKEIKIPQPPTTSPGPFTSADQKAVEGIIRQAGYTPQTMWGESHAVSLRQSKTRDGKPFSILDAYIETEDRGPRQDHSAEADGEWMSSEEVNRAFAPFYDKWAPRAKALQAKLRDAGYTSAEVTVEYGEKGHIGLNVFISSSTPRRQTEAKLKEGGGYFGRNYYDSVHDVKSDMKKGWFGPDTAEEICEKFGWDTDWIYPEEDDSFDYDAFFDDGWGDDEQLLEVKKLKESSVNKVLELVDTLVDDGYDEETARTVVAANFPELFESDEMYEAFLDGTLQYDDEDTFEDSADILEAVKKLGFTGEAATIVARWYEENAADPEDVTLYDTFRFLDASSNEEEARIVSKDIEKIGKTVYPDPPAPASKGNTVTAHADVLDAVRGLGFTGEAASIVAKWYTLEGAGPDEVSLGDVADLVDAASNESEISIVTKALENLSDNSIF